MAEFKKYVIRFGLLLAIIIPILLWEGYGMAFKTMLYKACMVAVAVMACELLWLFFFKPVFGKMEVMFDSGKLLAVLLFRGILYGAIILSFCLGL
jgi:hypothetical protein